MYNQAKLEDVFSSQSEALRPGFTVTIVGKGNSHTGMGRLTHAWLQALSGRVRLRFLNTRANEGDDVEYFDVLKVNQEEAARDPGEVCIFTDVLWNGSGDKNYELCPASTMKYAYCAFDSSKIPPEWVNIINNHFDGVIVTASFLVDVFGRCGVTRPVFFLPVALDLDEYFARPQKPIGDIYKFGLIGAYDFRKNIDLAAEAFEAAFGLDNTGVSLSIKLTYSHLGESEAAHFQQKFRGTNVIIQRGRLSNQDYVNFVDSLDVVVNLSRGEGYSIPVREGVALGKSLIITDHFAHADLGHLPAAILVKAVIPVPALYPQINERFFGLQYLPHAADVRNAFLSAYRRRHELHSSAFNSRDLARAWAVPNLRSDYVALIAPRHCALRGGNALISAAGSASSSDYYYRKCASLYGYSVARSARNKRLLGRTRSKTVTIGHDGGFFSVFNKFASYLAWEKEANPNHIILPDWSASSIMEYFKIDGFRSFCYAGRAEGNIWLKLFAPSPDVRGQSDIYNDLDLLYADADIADDFNEYREPWLTYKNAFELYKMPEFKRWRKWYHSVVSEQCKPLSNITERISKNVSGMDNSFKIGVHIRHPSHAMEQPGEQTAYTEKYIREIDLMVNERRISNPSIFLATDQESTVNTFSRYFGSSLFYDHNVKRTSLESDSNFEKLDAKERLQEGHQIQHLTAADPSNWSSQMAVEVLSDAYSLASCDCLLHVVSNISTAVSYLNPDLEMLFVGYNK